MEPTDRDLLLPHKHTNLITKSTFLIRQPAQFTPSTPVLPTHAKSVAVVQSQGSLPFTIQGAEAPTPNK